MVGLKFDILKEFDMTCLIQKGYVRENMMNESWVFNKKLRECERKI